MLFLNFLAQNIEKHRIDHISSIMSKHHRIFTENFMSLFSIAEKTGNVPEFKIEKL